MSATPRGRRDPLPVPPDPVERELVAVPDQAVFDALVAAAAARTVYDVATGVLTPLVQLDGVRAGAVVTPVPRGYAVAGSVGYACDTFAPQQLLPADAGLPVTEAARTGHTVVQGAGPSWVAVPVVGGGALLLSLTAGPPAPADLARLERLGTAIGPALVRAARADAREAELIAVELAAASLAPLPDVGVAVRSQAFHGELSGDVAEVVDTPRGRWLLVADVRGRGAAAAVPGLRIRAAFRALASTATGPGELLAAIGDVVRGGEEDFVTAVVVHLDGSRLRLASAGHPVPLLKDDSGVRSLAVEPHLPVGLGEPGAVPAESAYDVVRGALLVAYTDGLVDRRPEVDLAAALAATPAGGSVDQLADDLVAACDAVGRREDDASVAVLRV